MAIIQLIVLILLAFCMFFGIGFIVNMLMKTTWFPLVLYFGVVAYIVYWSWGSGYSIGDYLTFLSGLGGALLSGYTIKTLRVKGYKMF